MIYRSRVPKQVRRHRRKVIVLLAVTLPVATALAFGQPGGAQSVPVSTPRATSTPRMHIIGAERAHLDITSTAATSTTIAASAPTTTTTPTAITPVPASTNVATTPGLVPTAAVTNPATGPSVVTLVAEAEAAGVDPGPSWSWSMGDTATQCGVIPGGSVGTGCTFGPAGAARSVFAGSPSLALVAHELANAETENDAVPTLMSEVTAAEAGTSWSPIDAVASCLVVHFMGFQDDAAGTWQCPPALATLVADHIHDTLSAAPIEPG
jgi:hypothetical protein